MKKVLIIVITALCLLVIIIIGAIYFLPDEVLPSNPITDKIKDYTCLIKRGYDCSYGWGKGCSCMYRYKDGGKPCTNSSQCSSSKCLLKSSQLEQLGYDVYPDSNITNGAGKYENCSLKDIDKLPDNIDQVGECQTFYFDLEVWGCVGVLNNGNVKFECGCWTVTY